MQYEPAVPRPTDLVALALGANPVFAIVAAIATKGTGILAGFFAGYVCYFLADKIEKYLPEGIDMIVGALIQAPCAYLLAHSSEPVIAVVMGVIGSAITEATTSSPYVMFFLLGGLIKMICTSPLSSMALTAILGLTGLPMSIAAIACVGGSFTNGMLMKRLKLGDNNKVVAIMLEPLSQADIVTRNAFKIYSCNFFGGAMSGVVAVYFNIINDAPGTAAPIPGLLAPFAFNDSSSVLMAIAAAACGIFAGYVGTSIHLKIDQMRANKAANLQAVTA